MGTLEAVQTRHRKEQRDLQSRITNKKKNASKKTRKGVNDECAELERQLKDRQAQELASLNGEPNGAQDGADDEPEPQDETNGADLEMALNAVAVQFNSTTLDGDVASSHLQPPPNQQKQQNNNDGKKRNRQKERLARRAAEQEAAAQKAQEEAANMTDHRGIEKTSLLSQFKANGLTEKEIQPDGHCLFSAVADQLVQLSIPISSSHGEDETKLPPYKAVRRKATEYMKAHPDDFAPFLEEDFEGYVAKMRDTAEWGGQLELAALSKAYGVDIKVVQDGRTETIESGGQGEKEGRRIWLAYYRHGYGLGEHYNSLRKA
ncbi:uncharacterized protein BCR38DRAFT_424177 [Pseudomassariella vexata]|uniref:OTU domain-containing protein n=1 Tax=Pseudomassariella vexata TaxID=1141098 RepID=A0A1Y2EBQ2_9PEZI|nr:uncharacterized protein BCR38DRAFT_424177 [Pseudomassariella vexata]ORY68734.1 hypothetical protein BCR38DRAFT_424177 [Pseudomassariella vexata]